MRLNLKRLRIVSIGLLFAVIALLMLISFYLSYGKTSQYIDTAGYSKLMKKYDGFIGMPLEEAIPLLTKNGRYIMLDGDNLDTYGFYDRCDPLEYKDRMSVLCFPVQNSRSREECFIYSFLVDEESIVVSQADIQLSTDDFFRLYEDSKRQP